MRRVPGVRLPRTLSMDALRAPCVLKPRRNVDGSTVLYPLLCDSAPALAGPGQPRYALVLCQEFVRGQSHYLCGYLARDGSHVTFWQENLMQQPRGKSIVLARACRNPGVDADALMSHLHRLGYHGPLMVEFIVSAEGPCYIECNPRLWGPLQLALDACPALLDLYARDHGAHPLALTPAGAPYYYAWAFGARTPQAVVHPAGAGLLERDRLLRQHDVYARPDTAPLHDCH